jgi:predicted Zn finger-like uncharacterized protein
MTLNVRCDNCSSAYTFDEARVPNEGVSVKCSHCGYVFKVFKNDGGGTLGGGDWRVKTRNGSIFEFKELTTLQRWIVERKVTREDEISKTGRNWKRLGDIAELATFFQVVDQASAVSSPAPQPMGADPIQLQQAFPQPQGRRPTNPQWGAPDSDPNLRQPSGPYAMGAPPAMAQTGPDQFGGGPIDDDDDVDVKFKSGGGAGKWIAIALLVVAGVGVGGYFAKPEIFRPFVDGLLGRGIPELAQEHVKTGWSELAKDSNAAIDRARDNFEKALALADTFADARGGLAETELVRAENLLAEASELEMKLAGEADQAAAKSKIEALKKDAEAGGDKAFTLAKDALKSDPDGLVANRAMADYYRFKGAASQMQKLIDAAKKVAPSDAGIAYVLGSSMASDAAASERAMRYFDEALEKAPGMQRARWKMAQLYVTQNNLDKAKLHVKAILDAVPDHERAKALMLRLEPPPAPVAKPPEPPPAPEKEKPSFEKLLAQAERLRNGDRPQQALKMYEQALDMEPEDLDAMTGQGMCYLDLENPDAAISMFKQVLNAAPRFTDAHFGMGEAFRMKGMKRDAVKHYRTYIDILPDGPEADVARQMLQSLQ